MLDGAYSVGDGLLEKSKKDGADCDSEVRSDFGACLDDSETLEFVRDPAINEQVEGLGGLDDPLENNALQFKMED